MMAAAGKVFHLVCLGTLLISTRCLAADVVLSTNDGLSMSLDAANGALTHLSVDGIECASATALIWVETVNAASPGANIVSNGGFDSNTIGWTLSSSSLITRDTSVLHGGAASLRMVRSATSSPGLSASQSVTLNQSVAQPLLLKGWSKATLDPQNVNGLVNGGLGIGVTIRYQDGQQESRCQQAYFPPYTHDWIQAETVICPDKPIKSVTITVTLAADRVGTLWVDEIEVRQAQFVTPALNAPLQNINGAWRQQGDLAGIGMRGTVTYTPKSNCIEINGEIENLDSNDKTSTVKIGLPIDARTGKWWKYGRSSSTISGDNVYYDSFWYGAGRMGQHSMYPWSAVDLPNGKSLSLGVDIGEPQEFRLLYNGYNQRYSAEFDLGLTPIGPKPNKATFTAVLYRVDRSAPFRDATERYYAIYPWAFEKRVTKDGIWVPFYAVQSVPNWQDFGIQFNESAQDFAWETAQGLTSLMYIEPGCAHSHMYIQPTDPRSTGDAIQRVKDVLAGTRALNTGWYPRDPWTMDTMQAVLASYQEDAWGNPGVLQFPGEDAFLLNPAPNIPPSSGYKYNEADVDFLCMRTGLGLQGQYHLNKWMPYSYDYVRSYWVDTTSPHGGNQCIRVTTEPHYAHWSPWIRGVKQYDTLSSPYSGSVKVEYWVKGSSSGSGKLLGQATLHYADGTRQTCGLYASTVDGTWRRYEASITPKAPFTHFGFLVSLNSTSGQVWVDDVRFGPSGTSENWLDDGGFEDGGWLSGKMSGVYLDTLESSQCFLNHRREQFPHLQTNLTFDWSRRIVQPHTFGAWEFTREISKRLHKDGKLLMANASPLWSPFLIPYVDIGGQEEEWVPGGTGWSPKSDESFNWVRSMCATKPYCLLLMSRGDTEKVRKQIARCAFYGAFPSFGPLQSGSEVGLEGVYYWNSPALEQDRPIWKTYIPAIKRISEAGWRPLTYASSSNSGIWVERFGPANGGECYLSLFNPAAVGGTTQVTIDRSKLGLSGILRVTPILGTVAPITLAANISTFSVQVSAEDTVVVSITSGTGGQTLFSDEFTSFDTNKWSPAWAYPETRTAVAIDGTQALNMGYASGINKGITLASPISQSGDNMVVSVRFKPVGDPLIPLYIRLINAQDPLNTLFLNTIFWGSSPNSNLIGVNDQRTGTNYSSPANLWSAGVTPTNWLKYEMNMGRTTSVATVSSGNGAVLWQSPAIAGVGTMSIPNGLVVQLFGEYSSGIGRPVDTYVDSVVVTN